jgi:phospholipid transport system substrate-binding protein
MVNDSWRRKLEYEVKRILTSLAMFAVVLTAHPAWAQEPFEQVEQAIAELEAGVKGHEDELANDPAALYELVNRILLPRFDRKYSAQLVLGKNWRDADASQREQFIDGFYNSLLRKYAEGVLKFKQERVQLLPFRGDLSKTRTIVKTIVTLESGSKVTVNYGFAHRNDAWKMFDVTIEGISYVRNYRAEIDAEIRATSLDTVISRLGKEAGVHASDAGSAAGE